MADLIVRLNGKYLDNPHVMKVAEALRKLGCTRQDVKTSVIIVPSNNLQIKYKIAT